ncbi:hypothetical protein [Pasteuria penetrans]|uniref:hypothetical protein n=1 Tax=Pasteuria penetrans TaxID=86005 RepID=UPI000FB6EB7D|nr:hypothetical protein [Pasteuria penetrans]
MGIHGTIFLYISYDFTALSIVSLIVFPPQIFILFLASQPRPSLWNSPRFYRTGLGTQRFGQLFRLIFLIFVIMVNALGDRSSFFSRQ